jgi:uncharacterized protein YfaS (alpha-2-macroglobulin family)
VAETDEDERDLAYADACESLGDLFWLNERHWSFGNGREPYLAALDWWGRSSDIEVARERWLGILERMARPTWFEGETDYGHRNNWLPVTTLEQALEVAVEEEQRTRLSYYLMRSLIRETRDPWWDQRIDDAFEAVLSAGPLAEEYDDALFHRAEWLERTGRWLVQDDGSLTRFARPSQALPIYQLLVDGFAPSGSRYHREAGQRIRNITQESLTLRVNGSFLATRATAERPAGAYARYRLDWRNLDGVELRLHPVDLLAQAAPKDDELGAHRWFDDFDVDALPLARQWSVADGDHARANQDPHDGRNAELDLPGDALPPGSYLLVARAGAQESRDLLLISDVAAVAKVEGREHWVWVTDAWNGAPLANAPVTLLAHIEHDNDWRWERLSGRTDSEGIARFELTGPYRRSDSVVLAGRPDGDSQCASVIGGYDRQPGAGWRLFATTDRPAYRPGQLVRWWVAARQFEAMELATPAGEQLTYKIFDPRGSQVQRDSLTLSEFGTGQASLELSSDAALGEYRISFFSADGSKELGGAPLFRMEEYKRPEFEVAVRTPELDGRRETFVLGERVPVEITANTYFGAPLADADVEVVVRRRPYYHWRRPRARFDGFRSHLGFDEDPYQWWWRSDEEVHRTRTRTDEDGVAKFDLATDFGDGTEWEYTVEARVTDASRREVVGNGQVRLRRQSYAVEIDTPHRLVRPDRPFEVEFHALDANDQGVQVEGSALLMRATWVEQWQRPDGEIIDWTLGEAQPWRSGAAFGWRWVGGEWEYEEVARALLETDADGLARWSPTPREPGVYEVRWISPDEKSFPVRASAQVHALDGDSKHLGQDPQRLALIVDRDSLADDETLDVMLTSDRSGRWIWLTLESEGLIESRVVRMDGSARLFSFDLDLRHVPNLQIVARSIADGRQDAVSAEVSVTPVTQFLSVELTPESETVQPGDQGWVQVKVSDREGRGVRTEMSLALFDASLLGIQSELAGDPRKFFYGHRRGHWVGTTCNYDYKRGQDWVLDEGQLIPREHALYKSAGKNPMPDGPVLRESLKSLGYLGIGGGAGGGPASAGLAVRGLGQPPTMTARFESAAFANDMLFDQGVDFELESAMGGMRTQRGRQWGEVVAKAGQAPGGGAAGGEVTNPVVVVRSDFRETAFWQGDLRTDEEGLARIQVDYPDSTTRWRASARALSVGAAVGEFRDALVTARLPLVLRPQGPRFLTTGDEALVSAVLQNTTDFALALDVELDAEGVALEDGATFARRQVAIPAQGEAHVDFRVRATAPGYAEFGFKASGSGLGDAAVLTLPVKAHGIEVLDATAGRLDGDRETVRMALDDVADDTLLLEFSVNASPGGALLDALPYLARYPYGCLEQSLSRFVPAVVAARSLEKLGLDRDDIAAVSFGGIEFAHAARTHPEGNQAFAELEAVAKAGIDKVLSWQQSDGGFPWWSGGPTDNWMSAYAVWSLSLAREAGTQVDDGALVRAEAFLDQRLAEAEHDLHLAAWMAHALVRSRLACGRKLSSPSVEATLDRLAAASGTLTPYGRALLALTAKPLGRDELCATLLLQAENGLVRIDQPARSGITTASSGERLPLVHWGNPGRSHRWNESAVESTAFTLRALLELDPEHELIEPAMRWLVLNRRGGSWKSTRDTAIACLALTDYLVQTGAASEPVAFRLWQDGEVIEERTLEDPLELLAPHRFTLRAPRDLETEMVLERVFGDRPLYWSASARYVTTETPIQPRAADLFVRRDLYRLRTKPTLLHGEVFERVPLTDGDPIRSGERLEVVVTVQSIVDLEYVLIEDHKAAGWEATETKSGGPFYAYQLRKDEVERRFGGAANLLDAPFRKDGTDRGSSSSRGRTGQSRFAYRELRDDRAAIFLDKLPAGVWELSHTLRDEALLLFFRQEVPHELVRHFLSEKQQQVCGTSSPRKNNNRSAAPTRERTPRPSTPPRRRSSPSPGGRAWPGGSRPSGRRCSGARRSTRRRACRARSPPCAPR